MCNTVGNIFRLVIVAGLVAAVRQLICSRRLLLFCTLTSLRCSYGRNVDDDESARTIKSDIVPSLSQFCKITADISIFRNV